MTDDDDEDEDDEDGEDNEDDEDEMDDEDEDDEDDGSPFLRKSFPSTHLIGSKLRDRHQAKPATLKPPKQLP